MPVSYSDNVNISIPYNGELHRRILPMLQGRVQRAKQGMAEREVQWAKNEEQFLAYMPAKDVDVARKTKRDGGEPQFTTLEIPYSYAILLTEHTYITSTFLGRDPILQVKGRHGEAQMSEMAMESLLDYQVNAGGHLVPYYVWTLDALKYGIGIIGYYWDEERIKVRKRQRVNKTFLGVPIPGAMETVETEEEVKGYEGTRAYNCRPQDFFFDPSYPASQFQKGEFCGRYIQMSWLDYVDGVHEECYMNLDAMKLNQRDTNRLRILGSSQIVLPNQSSLTMNNSENSAGFMECYEIYVRLVPYDWGLGNSRQTEKWVFLLANDSVIIMARPLGYYHNKFPFEILEPEVDGHSLYARSALEPMKPLNDTMTWLINTHFYNVRKALNDQLVVDPSKIVMKDLTSGGPGRLIRLKPAAYGSDARLAVAQLPIQDITRAHINDTAMLQDMLQRVTGVNDSLMGAINTGRKTATEVRSSTTFGINRLKTVTEYMSAMGFAPFTQQIIQTTQQMYDDDRKFRIVGDGAIWAGQYMNVTPDQIAGFYDFSPVDGTLPVDRFAQVNLWQQLIGQAGKMPAIAQGYDFAKIFAFIAQLAGLKNINQFKIQVVPDGQAQMNAQSGNSVAAVADPMANGSNVEPQQLPGMGQTL